METRKAVFLLIIAVFAFASLNEKRTPAPVEEIPPEQSHYAVFYFVCGKYQTVLMTTEPPIMGFAKEPGSLELLDLLKATPAERIIELRYVGPECYYIRPGTKLEPIL